MDETHKQFQTQRMRSSACKSYTRRPTYQTCVEHLKKEKNETEELLSLSG